MKYLRAWQGALTPLAEFKSIRYRLSFPAEEITTWFDPDKLEKIIVNLLTNAFKFTPEAGDIIFSALCKSGDDRHIVTLSQFSVLIPVREFRRTVLKRYSIGFTRWNHP